MNIIKKFIDSGTKQELACIPAGQFFLLRSSKSPKASIEYLHNDVSLIIREASTHTYKLVVRKGIDGDGVEGGSGNNDDDDDETSLLSGQSGNEDEWSFQLKDGLDFHKAWNKFGDITFIWKNTEGDKDERFQFVVNSEISLSDVDQFLQAIYHYEYDNKNKTPFDEIEHEELRNFKCPCLMNEDVLFSDEDENDEVKRNIETTKLTNRLYSLDVDTETEDSETEIFEDAQEIRKI